MGLRNPFISLQGGATIFTCGKYVFGFGRQLAHRALDSQTIAPEQSGNFIPAQQLLQRSLSIARRQGALSWELRTSVSLARLWQSQGLISQALELLRTAMTQFTEGFETRDFFQARQLLEELQAQAEQPPARISGSGSRRKQLLGPGRNVPVTRMDFVLPLR